MPNRTNFLLLCCLLFTTALTAQQDPQQLFYIQQYKDIAIREMMRTGIPSSITLAQGLLESTAGQSDLAQVANNQFGIKCGMNWTGLTFYKQDDDYDFNGQLIPSCFRAYPTVEASFQDHSNFLTDPQKAFRYGPLFNLGTTNYEAWAHGLKKAGYATIETYPQILIDLILRYQLHEYDLVFPLPTNSIPPTAFPPLISSTNEVAQTFASGYETAEDIAARTNLPLKDLLTFNERLVAGYVLPQGEKIYLNGKRRAYRGPLQYHEVKAGETMYDIAQKYGLKLNRLLMRNRLSIDDQLQLGQLIKLQRVKRNIPPPNPSSIDFGFDEDPLPEVKPIPNTTILPPELIEKINQLPQKSIDLVVDTSVFHLVEKGDTLWNISNRYQTTVEQLKLLNKLNDNNILRGMSLRVK
jgi:LysM repeat protein